MGDGGGKGWGGGCRDGGRQGVGWWDLGIVAV